MAIDIKDSQDELSALNREAALEQHAPGRRFESPDRQERTLRSHMLISTIGIGLAAYLGRVQDVYAPSPNDAMEDGAGRPGMLDAGAPSPALDPVVLAQQLASFWTEYLQSYLDETDGLRRYVRYNGLSVDFGRISYGSEFGLSRVAALDLDNNMFKFYPDAGANAFLSIRFALPGNHSTPTPITNPGNASGQAGAGNSGSGQGGAGNSGGNGSGNGNSENRAPVATGLIYLGSGLVNLSILLAWADLARAGLDPDGDRLSISNINSSSGTVSAHGVDVWLFTPSRDMNGIVSFTYTLSDGQSSVTGRAWLDLRLHPQKEIVGTDGDDTLLGTPKDDIIKALDGDDVVYGREGHDLIDGGAGNDTLVGGDGNDVIYGGKGHDRILGGRGDDVLFGDEGNDFIYGEEGNDIAYGGAGHDVISGGAGNDHLFGEAGNDVISGDAGDDVLDGGDGNDQLIGGEGNDVVLGGEGDDVFIAGVLAVLEQELENDASCLVTVPLPDGNDVFDGGSGCDTYDASATQAGVDINLHAGTAHGVEIGTDRLISVENAIGGSGNDRVTASDTVNVMIGGQGNDIFVFATTSSLRNGGSGRDEIRDFEIGDKIDFSKLSADLGALYFGSDDLGMADPNGHDHRTLIKLYKELTDDGENRQVVQIYSDLDADDKYELVVISQQELNSGDFILTVTVAHADNGSITV
ncbi:calcium-binding protein [Agrobacterium burrii]